MKSFDSEEALSLRVRFEVRYASDTKPLQSMYCVDWQAKWQENLTLADFVLQYLESIRVANNGNLIAYELMDDQNDGTEPFISKSRRTRVGKRRRSMLYDQEKLEVAMGIAGPLV